MRWIVVDRIGVKRSNHAQIVGALRGQLRPNLRDHLTALTPWLERMLRRKTIQLLSLQLRNLLTLGDRFGHRLTMHLGQLGLVVKRLQMRHPTGHVQPYNPLGPRRMMQRLEDTRQAARAIETHRPILSTQERPQGHGPKTDPGTLQKRPPSDPIDS
jgi:hypothetical protein